MPKFYILLSYCFYIFLVFTTVDVRAQLPAFALEVTAFDEACPGNGSLNFTVTGTVDGASVLYNIYKFPNLTTPIATVAANTLGGLTAGSYRVIATQSLNGETSSEQQDVVINYTYMPLIYSIGIQSCGAESEMTIDVTQGIGYQYEIFGGPMLFPPQASNVFSGLIDGTYQVRVHDNCGSAYASSYTVVAVNQTLVISAGAVSNSPLSCDEVDVQHEISVAGGSINFPLTLQYTVYPPSGPPIVVNSTISSGGNPLIPETSIPFFAGGLYSYTLTVTDGCGNVATLAGNPVSPTTIMNVSVNSTPKGCSRFALIVSPNQHNPPYFITFISAPTGFDPAIFNDSHPGPFTGFAEYFDQDIDLPVGTYTVSITDSCGRTDTDTYYYDGLVVISQLGTSSIPGCDPGFGSIAASTGGAALVSMIIVSAPAAYQQQLPYDVSFNIAAGSLYMNGLPIGNYVFNSIDDCGVERTTTITVGSASSTFTASVIPACNSFNLLIQHNTNINSLRKYYLQVYDPVTNTWGHPATGVTGPVPNTDTGFQLLNNTLNINLQYAGTFRIMFTYLINGNGTTVPVLCVKEMYTFEYNNAPEIIDIIAYSCSPTTYDVLVEATGEAPLLYRILTKDGVPFVLQNGTSNIFTSLAPGVYTFQVEDACGNLMNRVFDTTEPFQYVITATSFCDGQYGALSVPAFAFINYEWWHDSNPSVILSTSPILEFNPLDAATDIGLYHVRIYAPDTTPSCIDFVVDYEITSQGSLPDAGEDVTEIFCVNPGAMNLFTLLYDATDTSGTWQNLDSGTDIEGSLWNATAFSAGTFHFGYTVNGWCGAIDAANITIIIDSAPAAPIAFIDQNVCEGAALQLFADGASTYQYQWTGPNGFESNLQNPIIEPVSELNSGTYSVTASNGNCTSVPAPVEVLVNPIHEISLAVQCIDDEYTLTVISPEALPDNTIFTWTGPSNYSAAGNSVAITHLDTGIYNVSADYGNGCPSTAKIPVTATSCGIPQGISPNGDGDNDTLDLTEFDAKKIKIFNRYGMVVFESATDEKQWDGTDYNGNELPTATYFYLVTLNSGEELTGWIYLIRS